jgi:hypothetical protein
MGLIYVKSNLPPTADGGDPVAFWERNPEHPDGEVFVAGSEPVQVAETGEVNGAIKDGRVVKVEGAKSKTKTAADGPPATPETGGSTLLTASDGKE